MLSTAPQPIPTVEHLVKLEVDRRMTAIADNMRAYFPFPVGSQSPNEYILNTAMRFFADEMEASCANG